MDLFIIDPVTWLPVGAPLRHYTSLIWTEKFITSSEFELRTYTVIEVLRTLPRGTLVGIRQSKEVMMVEELFVETSDQGVETLTVKGKSISSFVNHRVVGEKRGVKYEMSKDYTNLDGGLVVLWNSFDNPDAYDYTAGKSAYYKNPLDFIPNVAISDSTDIPDLGAASRRSINPGPISEVIYPWFEHRPFGLRMVRPPYTTQHVVVSQAGVVSRTLHTNGSELCFDVYNGNDRSHTQSIFAPVILDAEHDDLMLPNYMFSIVDFKNEAHIVLDGETLKAYSAGLESLGGLERRVRFIDGGAPEDGANYTAFKADSIKSAEEALEENQSFTMADGTVSSQSLIQYGTDYFLGDLITVRGPYGVMTITRVVEYIRNEDETGEGSYPTLVQIGQPAN